MHDIRARTEYADVERFLTAWHAPAFGRPHALADPELSRDGTGMLVVGSVLERLEGTPEPRLLTLVDGRLESAVPGAGASRCGRFSPDGARFAYLADPRSEGDFQLRIASTSDVDPVIDAPRVDGTIEYLQWSPDGTRVLLGVAGRGAELSGSQGSGAHARPAESAPSWHPHVETDVPEHAWRTLWIHDLRTGALEPASAAGVNCWEASWSGPDGILAITSDAPTEDSWYDAVLSLIDPQTRTSRVLLSSDVQLALPSGSPDGRFASVVEAVCSDRQVVAGDLSVIELDSGIRTRVDTHQTDVTMARWFDDHRLGYAGQRGLESVLGRFDAVSGVADELLTAPRSWGPRYPDAAFSAHGDALLVEDAYRMPHRLVAVSGGDAGVVADVGQPGTEQLLEKCGHAKPVSWDAPDGLRIDGMLVLPDGDGPFPLVVNIHGGPVWAFQDSWSMNYAWVPLLVSRGYAVLSPNPRGSGGRGQDFAARVVGDMGGADARDILSGIDALVADGTADPTRLGLIGGSYGGFMSSWLVTQDQRFAAAVPISPVTDWYSQSFTSNISGWGTAFLRADPEVPGNAVHSRSPVLQASRVRTPCLNIAGARDRCTPPDQAREFHQALAAHGVESALVIYPEEGHGVRNYSAMTDFLTRVTMWFDRHMPA